MINPDAISTAIVGSALWTYRLYYGTSYWPHFIEKLQAAIDASGLSIPLPVIELPTTKLDIPKGNPFEFERPVFKQLIFKGDVDARARSVAQTLYKSGLPTFYLDLTKAIDLTLDRQGQAIDDIAYYAPVLVYCHSSDGRDSNISALLKRLFSSRVGIRFLIQEELPL